MIDFHLSVQVSSNLGGSIILAKSTNNIHNALRHSFIIGAGAFFLAILASLAAKILLDNILSIIISLILLLIIILIGIIFDIVGVAVAAADESPLHAKCAKKLYGAGHAIRLVRNAAKVASFCNDVIGDICGTLSGAVGAIIVLRIILHAPTINDVILSILMTSLIAAFTVAGKAFGKYFAIRKATDIIFHTGKILEWMERNLYIVILNGNKKGRLK